MGITTLSLQNSWYTPYLTDIQLQIYSNLVNYFQRNKSFFYNVNKKCKTTEMIMKKGPLKYDN